MDHRGTALLCFIGGEQKQWCRFCFFGSEKSAFALVNSANTLQICEVAEVSWGTWVPWLESKSFSVYTILLVSTPEFSPLTFFLRSCFKK